MPFNASGVFQRLYNWVNDRDAAVRIRADRMDQEMDGMAEAINEVVDGTQPLRGNIRTINGTTANPAFSFTADQDTGFYRKAANILALVAGGSNILELSSSQITALQDFAKGTFKIDGNFLSFENGEHWITYGEGGDDFNIRIGHKYDGSNLVYTHNNQGAIHLEFDHENATPSFKIHIATPGTLGSTVTWDHTFTFNSDGTSDIDADKLDGQHGSYYRNATNLNAGTISTARLPMGAGNNLDADKLDGLHAVSFLRSDTNNTATGRISFTNSSGVRINSSGSTPDGTTSTFEKGLTVIGGNQRLNIDASDETNGGSYIQTRHISSTHPDAYYRLKLNPLGGEVTINGHKAWHAGNDGVGSGLDADMLDGQQGSFYQNAGNINAGTLPSARLSGSYTITASNATNAGQAVNADKLDNLHAASFLRSDANDTATGRISFTNSSGVRINSSGSNPDNTTATYEKGITIVGGNQRLVIDASSTVNGGSYIQTRHDSGTYPNAYYELKLNPQGGTVSVRGNPVAITSYNAVGSYIFASRNTNGTIVANTNYAGSGLIVSGFLSNGTYTDNTAISISGGTLSGTWRAMGNATSSSSRRGSTLFVRIT